MTELDAKWAEAVLNAYPELNVSPKPYKAVCCCSGTFTYEGVQYTATNAGCAIHGLRSRHIPQVGNLLKEKRSDGKRHTAYVQGGKD